MTFFDIKIETDRLRLVPIETSYAEKIFKLMDKEVTKYMYPKQADYISDTLAWIKSSRARMEKGANIQLVILKKDTGEFIGCAGLHETDTKTPELGVWTKKASHGNGYGKEAIRALYFWAEENIEFDYMKYPVDKRNIASRKIPESLGGEIASEYKSTNRAGFELEEAEYRIYPEKALKRAEDGTVIKFYKPESFRHHLYVIIASRYQDKWVFVRQKTRDTWELPGGHIEPGEKPEDAAKRELMEETGALEFEIRAVCDVSLRDEDKDEFSFSRLFYAEIKEFGPLPEDFEIGEIMLSDDMPDRVTYPFVQTIFFNKVKEDINKQ